MVRNSSIWVYANSKEEREKNIGSTKIRRFWNQSELGCASTWIYGVATISRILKITGLFGRISSLLYVSFAEETYNF